MEEIKSVAKEEKGTQDKEDTSWLNDRMYIGLVGVRDWYKNYDNNVIK